MGTWQEDTVPPRFKRADAIFGVFKTRPVTISQNKPKAITNSTVRQTPFMYQRPHHSPHFGTSVLESAEALKSYQGIGFWKEEERKEV